jgi:hypothetical protein
MVATSGEAVVCFVAANPIPYIRVIYVNADCANVPTARDGDAFSSMATLLGVLQSVGAQTRMGRIFEIKFESTIDQFFGSPTQPIKEFIELSGSKIRSRGNGRFRYGFPGHLDTRQ